MNSFESLTKTERNYLCACSHLMMNEFYNSEIIQIHSNLLHTSPEFRLISDNVLQCFSKLGANYFELELALWLLESLPKYPPANHLLAIVLKHECTKDKDFEKAFKILTENTEYLPSVATLSNLYFDNNIPEKYSKGEQVVNRAYAYGLIKKVSLKGYPESDYLISKFLFEGIYPFSLISSDERKLKGAKMVESSANSGCMRAKFYMAERINSGSVPYDTMSKEDRKKLYLEKLEALCMDGYCDALEKIRQFINDETNYKYLDLIGRKKLYLEKLCKIVSSKWVRFDTTDPEYQTYIKGGIFTQEIFNAIFYNAFVSDDFNENCIEGDNFLLYSEDGFNLNYIASICQGKAKTVLSLGNSGYLPEFEVCKNNETFPELLKDYKEKTLKKSQNFELDLSALAEKEFKIKFCILRVT